MFFFAPGKVFMKNPGVGFRWVVDLGTGVYCFKAVRTEGISAPAFRSCGYRDVLYRFYHCHHLFLGGFLSSLSSLSWSSFTHISTSVTLQNHVNLSHTHPHPHTPRHTQYFAIDSLPPDITCQYSRQILSLLLLQPSGISRNISMQFLLFRFWSSVA